MPIILRRLPITESAESITFPLGQTTLKPNQIVVWVALTPPAYPDPPPTHWRFPAILDTGSGYPFLIHRNQFDSWVTRNQISLPRLSEGRVLGRNASRFRADLWIFRNEPGRFAELLTSVLPFRAAIQDFTGIIVSEVSEQFGSNTPVPRPRLPLIGLPFLEENALTLVVDGNRKSVALRRGHRFWFLND